MRWVRVKLSRQIEQTSPCEFDATFDNCELGQDLILYLTLGSARTRCTFRSVS